MYRKCTKKFTGLLTFAVILSLMTGCGNNTKKSTDTSKETDAKTTAAEAPAKEESSKTDTSDTKTADTGDAKAADAKDPFGAYQDGIKLTLGRQTLQNAKLPDGDTYENNAYTRWVKQLLNIDIADEFEANGDDYDTQVALTLSSGEMPDMMKVNTLDELNELVENDMIADLTDVYNNYATDYVKSVYDSFEGRALAKVTYDGKLYAIPGTNTDSGPSEVWIRSDWMDQLGIKLDEDNNGTISIDDIVSVAKTFMEKNPANAENLVGISFAPWITSGDPDGTYSINSIAYAMGAYPKTWYQENGKLVYGSTTPAMKEALRVVAGWYKDGLADPQLGTRTWDDITALLCNGQTGITFGTWHIPDWLLNNVRATDAKATFNAYAVADANGKVNCKHNDAAAGYIVVRKDYEHPEAAIKIVNMFYDTMKTSPDLAKDVPEVYQYQQNGVDGSTRPFNIEINSYTSLMDDYQEIVQGYNGEIPMEQVSTTESKSIIDSVKAFMNDPSNPDNITGWSKYHSRFKGVALMKNLMDSNTFQWLSPVFPQTTTTMEMSWGNLETLEEETTIKIVLGELDVDSGFDEFVKNWNEQGGEQIISEIEEQIK